MNTAPFLPHASRSRERGPHASRSRTTWTTCSSYRMLRARARVGDVLQHRRRVAITRQRKLRDIPHGVAVRSELQTTVDVDIAAIGQFVSGGGRETAGVSLRPHAQHDDVGRNGLPGSQLDGGDLGNSSIFDIANDPRVRRGRTLNVIVLKETERRMRFS